MPASQRGGVLARVLVLLVLVALAGAAALAYLDYRRFGDAPLGVSQASIDVPRGAALPAIVTTLHPQADAWELLRWRLLARELGVAGKLHAGEYALDASVTPRALLAKMAAGEVIQHRFTIVEGWTFSQLRDALSHDPLLVQTLPALDDNALMRALGENDVPPEGQFLPETYSFVKGMSDAEVLRRAHEALKKSLDQLWSAHAADTPLQNAYQALILASIVEKETARADERPQIARVFLTRLKLGMKLQTDPSVIYGLGAAYDGKIHRRDLDTDTPFNTYTRTGLPPTPIALPGRAALEATLHPAETAALYFVARGDGSHEFSPTLEAHNLAVAKYQLHRN